MWGSVLCGDLSRPGAYKATAARSHLANRSPIPLSSPFLIRNDQTPAPQMAEPVQSPRPVSGRHVISFCPMRWGRGEVSARFWERSESLKHLQEELCTLAPPPFNLVGSRCELWDLEGRGHQAGGCSPDIGFGPERVALLPRYRISGHMRKRISLCLRPLGWAFCQLHPEHPSSSKGTNRVLKELRVSESNRLNVMSGTVTARKMFVTTSTGSSCFWKRGKYFHPER